MTVSFETKLVVSSSSGGGSGTGGSASGTSNAAAAGEGSLPVSSVQTKGGSHVEIKELRSEDGRFRFVVQTDGNLVLFMGTDAIWAVYTNPPSSPRPQDASACLILQADGNLVVVDSARNPIWSSDTAGCGRGPFRLTMQNDGNCVLSGAGGVPCWATKTCGWG